MQIGTYQDSSREAGRLHDPVELVHHALDHILVHLQELWSERAHVGRRCPETSEILCSLCPGRQDQLRPTLLERPLLKGWTCSASLDLYREAPLGLLTSNLGGL